MNRLKAETESREGGKCNGKKNYIKDIIKKAEYYW